MTRGRRLESATLNQIGLSVIPSIEEYSCQISP